MRCTKIDQIGPKLIQMVSIAWQNSVSNLSLVTNMTHFWNKETLQRGQESELANNNSAHNISVFSPIDNFLYFTH